MIWILNLEKEREKTTLLWKPHFIAEQMVDLISWWFYNPKYSLTIQAIKYIWRSIYGFGYTMNIWSLYAVD